MFHFLCKSAHGLFKSNFLFESTPVQAQIKCCQSSFQLNMPHLRNYRVRHPDPSGWVVQRLTQLLPMDLWFYNYAKEMHNVRWRRFLKQRHGQDTRPTNMSSFTQSLPHTLTGCRTTRFIISCPQERFYYHSKKGGEMTSLKQLSLLPKS